MISMHGASKPTPTSPLRQAAETAGAIVQYTTYGLKDGKLTSKRTEDLQGRTNVEINEAAELRDRMLT